MKNDKKTHVRPTFSATKLQKKTQKKSKSKPTCIVISYSYVLSVMTVMMRSDRTLVVMIACRLYDDDNDDDHDNDDDDDDN